MTQHLDRPIGKRSRDARRAAALQLRAEGLEDRIMLSILTGEMPRPEAPVPGSGVASTASAWTLKDPADSLRPTPGRPAKPIAPPVATPVYAPGAPAPQDGHDHHEDEIREIVPLLPQTYLFDYAGFLTGPGEGDPLDLARSYLAANAEALGASPSDLDELVVTDRYQSSHNGLTHLWLRQSVSGVPIANSSIGVHVDPVGRIVAVAGQVASGIDAMASGVASMAASAWMSATDAVASAAGALGYQLDAAPMVKAGPWPDSTATMISAAGFSDMDIAARVQYVAAGDSLELAWGFAARTPDGRHWFDVSVGGTTGELLALSDWVDHASYNVFAPPVTDPADGPRTIEVDPHLAAPIASPFGWHDTDGVPGPEFTDTRGNNVFAQEDADANNSGGFRPDGGPGLNFDFPIDFSQDPSSYRSAAIANLFYWNNILHDVHYRYGFDEVSGNFQQNNYGRGGLGNDPVQADAQDGSGVNNANFATPPDGFAPRMQQFIFTLTTPFRDSSLSNDIIAHEYGHGVTNRLTGGPANSNALNALQSGGMGEGWSDFYSLMFGQRGTDGQFDAYPVGTYVLGQPQNGPGIRRFPYSFDMSINPLTYDNFNGGFPNNQVHNAGEIWASALWDMNWLLINKLGYSPDLYNGTAGNNMALQLVMDGLKLQPANPSFLDGRDGILLADTILNGGANHPEIWAAFARRGMGLSASDGGSGNSAVVVAAFDVPEFSLRVVGTDPAVGSVVTTQPTEFTVDFSFAVDPTSVQAEDFAVNGIAADSVSLVDENTARFTYDTSPVTAEGLQTMEIEAGAILRSNGDPILAFVGNFRFDSANLQVVGTNPPVGSLVALPTVTLDLDFNEPFDPATLNPSDLLVSAGVVTSASAIDADTARFTIEGLTSEGTLSVRLPAAAMTDPFGNPNVEFIGTYEMDFDSLPFPTPLVARAPAGSMIHDAVALGRVGVPGDVDQFTLSVDPGQTVALLVTTSGETLVPKVSLVGPGGLLGSATAPAAGEAALMQAIAMGGPLTNTTASPIDLTIIVEGAGGSSGDYELHLVLNAGIEEETYGGPPNDTTGSASVDLAGAFIPLAPGAPGQAIPERAAVIGQVGVGGYTPQAVPFTFEDISTTGTPTLQGFDDGFFQLTAGALGGFTFDFYGTTYNSLFFSSNGLITFGSGNGSFSNSDLTFSPDQAAIAPFWDDLFVDNAVYWQVKDAGLATERLIIQWDEVGFFVGNLFELTFQAVLRADGSIQFNYLDLDDPAVPGSSEGRSATVGTKDAGPQGANRTLGSFNDGPNAVVGTGQSTRFELLDIDVDLYAIELATGDTLSLAAATSGGIGQASLSLLAPDGTPLSIGSDDGTGSGSVIPSYLATTAGTYYARVEGSGQYQLVATRNATFDAGSNDSVGPDAQELNPRQVLGQRYALGHVGSPLPGGGLVFDELPFQPVDGVSINGVSFDFTIDGSPSTDAFYNAGGPGQTVYISDPSVIGNVFGVLGMEFDVPTSTLEFGAALSTVALVEPGFTVRLFDAQGDLIDTIDVTTLPIVSFSEALFQYQGTPVKRAEVDFNENSGAGQFAFDNLVFGSTTDTDIYAISVPGNRPLDIQALVPAGGPGAIANGLDPMIRLYDPSGNLVATNDNGGADGRSARLTYRTPRHDTLTYYVEVLASTATDEPTTGEYVLSVQYANAVPQPFGVVAIDPPDGSEFRFAPSFTIDFNDNVLLSSLQASDVLFNGTPATSLSIVDGDTVVVAPPDGLPDGTYTIEILAGSILDTQGTPIGAFSSSFVLDQTAPRVIASSIQEGDVLDPGLLVYTVTFDEPMDVDAAGFFDVSLAGLYRNTFFSPEFFQFDPTGTSLTIAFFDLPDDRYTLQLSSGAFRDLVGNSLDGEPNFPIPPNTSGDGFEGGDFFVSFAIDPSVDPLLPPPATPVLPQGSLIYRGSQADGTITSNEDVDNYLIELDAGQTLTVRLDALDSFGNLVGTVTLLDPGGVAVASAAAATPGGIALLQTAPVETSGLYTVQVSGDSGSEGLYSLQSTLNAALELETITGETNNDFATAQDLDPSFIPFGVTGGERGAVIGFDNSAGAGGSGIYTAQAVPFAFEDISTTGTPTLQGFDDGFFQLTAGALGGFTFDFYGTTYSSLFFSSNGLITFGSGDSSFSNTDLTTSPNQAAIAPFWDDLFVDNAVYWQVKDAGLATERLIIQWDRVGFFVGNLFELTFQAVLGADGSIQFNYLDLDDPAAPGSSGGGSATVGTKDVGPQGDNRLLTSFNSGPNEFVGTGLSTRITSAPAAGDYYAVSLEAGQYVTVAATNLPRSASSLPAIELYNSAGDLLASDAPTALAPILENGSFESGVFSPWTATDAPDPFVPWLISGAGDGSGFFPPTSPQDGALVAWNGFDAGVPGDFVLTQEVTIPADATVAELDWLNRLQWDFTLAAGNALARTYQVQVRNPATNAVLATLYDFSTGNETTNPTGDTGWTSHTADLSAFIGQTVRLAFVQSIPESFTGPGQYELDGVVLTTDAPTGDGGPSADNVDALIRQFQAPEAGTYYIRVASNREYSLVVTRGADFDAESNDSLATAQDIDGPAAVLGAIETVETSSVVPSSLANTDGNFNNAWPFNIGAFGVPSMRYQQIYAASDIPSGGVIDALRFRRDVFDSTPLPPTALDVQVNIGYAATSFSTVSPVFAENIGPGLVTVLDGIYLLSSGTETGNPNPLDIVLDVDNLFDYDPSQGDLIVEILMRNSPFTRFLDASAFGEQAVTTRVYGFDVNDSIGNVDGLGGGLVTQFDFISDAVVVEDNYSVSWDPASEALLVTTSTPAGGPGAFVNQLDPQIELYDPSGVLVATGTTLDDGRNEVISLAQGSDLPSGVYTIRVLGQDGTFGEFGLAVERPGGGELLGLGAGGGEIPIPETTPGAESGPPVVITPGIESPPIELPSGPGIAPAAIVEAPASTPLPVRRSPDLGIAMMVSIVDVIRPSQSTRPEAPVADDPASIIASAAARNARVNDDLVDQAIDDLASGEDSTPDDDADGDDSPRSSRPGRADASDDDVRRI